MLSIFFFFNDTATTEIYTLSLHDALPIFLLGASVARMLDPLATPPIFGEPDSDFLSHVAISREHYTSRRNVAVEVDRKSTRLNSSHQIISYAVFCLKKKIKLDPPRLDPFC